MDRLIFVCKGNICRSAFAEAVARSIGFEAISCGLDTSDGKPANDMAITQAASKGFELSGHRTRKISSVKINTGDLLIVMEPSQIELLEKILGNKHSCTIMGLWGSPVYPYIYDPYGTNVEYFKRCFDYIELSVCVIAKKLADVRKV